MITEEEYLNNLGELLLRKSALSIDFIEETFGISVSKMVSDDLSKKYDTYILENKRKSTGSFYTPDYIAKYMVSKALFEYFKNNTSLSDQRLTSIFYSRKYNLSKQENKIFLRLFKCLTIADLSCGAGVFLISYMKLVQEILLVNEHKDYRNDLKAIAKNVHAYDINVKAIKSLLLELNIHFKPKNEEDLLMINTHSFDIITSDKFQKTVPKNGFDIVIGNPPYLGEKGNKSLFNEIKKSDFGRQYYEGKMDLFYYFIYRGINVLSSSGVLVYLTTNYFITADGAKKLRKYLKEEGRFIEIINFNEYKLFDDAKGQHNLIFSYERSKKVDTLVKNIEGNNKVNNFNEFSKIIAQTKNKYSINKKFLFNERNMIQLYINTNHFSIIKKIKLKSTHRLKDFFNVNQGLVSGADRVSKYNYNKKLSQESIDLYNIKIGDSIYVMDKNKSNKFSGKNYLKKFYKNSDINKFSVNKPTNKRIVYVDSQVELDPVLKNHLLPYKEILEARREVKTGSRQWYEIQWPRKKEIFEEEKIVVPQRSSSNIFAYNDIDFYGSADIYYITTKKLLEDYSLMALLGLLNSKLFYIYLSNIGKKKGNMLELYATPIKHLFIKRLRNEDTIIKLTKKLICRYDEKIYGELNQLIYEDYDISKEEIKFIEKFYNQRHQKNNL